MIHTKAVSYSAGKRSHNLYSRVQSDCRHAPFFKRPSYLWKPCTYCPMVLMFRRTSPFLVIEINYLSPPPTNVLSVDLEDLVWLFTKFQSLLLWNHFFDASSHLYKRVCPSICPSLHFACSKITQMLPGWTCYICSPCSLLKNRIPALWLYNYIFRQTEVFP